MHGSSAYHFKLLVKISALSGLGQVQVLAACLCPLDVAIVEHVQQKQQLDPEPALK